MTNKNFIIKYSVLCCLVLFLGSLHGAGLEPFQDIPYEKAQNYTFCDSVINCMDCSVQYNEIERPLIVMSNESREICCLRLNPYTSGIARIIKTLSLEEESKLSLPISPIEQILFAPSTKGKGKGRAPKCLSWFKQEGVYEVSKFAACNEQSVYVYDTKKKKLNEIPISAGPIQAIRWLNKDLLLILTYVNMLQYSFLMKNIVGSISLPLKGSMSTYQSFDCLGPQRKILALAENDHLLWYDLQTSTYEKVALGKYQKDVLMIRSDPMGHYVAISSNDGKVLIWKSKGKQPLLQLVWCPSFLGEGQESHGKVVWAPHGNRLLCVDKHEIRVWELEKALHHIAFFPLWIKSNILACDLASFFPKELVKVIKRYVSPDSFVRTCKVSEGCMFCAATFFSQDTICIADSHNYIKKLSLKGYL
ncbi:MAG: WD40 repeat domain-containing protein [Bacteroidota bacterium]